MCLIGALAGIALPVSAITITANSPKPEWKPVVDDAVAEWSALVGGKDGLKLQITIDIDSSIGGSDLGSTVTYDVNSDGKPDRADISLASGLNWTVGPPVVGKYDALAVLKHEIGHALGWGNSSSFYGYVAQPGGDNTNRWFDFYDDDTYDPAWDVDLEDGTTDTGKPDYHAAPGTGDVMEGNLDEAQRRHPGLRDFAVLSRVYGYMYPDVPAVPEPETWALMVAGLGILGAIRRRRPS